MKHLLLFILVLLSFRLYGQRFQDYIVSNEGDTIFCTILGDIDWYRPRSHHVLFNFKYKNLVYNGYHGVIASVGKDSFLFYAAHQMKSYYQQNDHALRRYPFHPSEVPLRPKGSYRQFDLGKLAKLSSSDMYKFRYVMATPATEEVLAYPIKYNAPYQLFVTRIADIEGDSYRAYILSKGAEAYILASPRNLRRLAERKGIPNELWQQGGGDFKQKMLRLQFALNRLQGAGN